MKKKKSKKTEVIIRKAELKDAKGICDLIGYYAKKEIMLPRSLGAIYEGIREYNVAELDKKVIGCCAIKVVWNDLAEVRSLAVNPRHRKKKLGSKLLYICINEARDMGIKTLFTLTLNVDFFKGHDFEIINSDALPMKVWGECANCPKFMECDEIAMARKI